jgi:hypothetical protein
MEQRRGSRRIQSPSRPKIDNFAPLHSLHTYIHVAYRAHYPYLLEGKGIQLGREAGMPMECKVYIVRSFAEGGTSHMLLLCM